MDRRKTDLPDAYAIRSPFGSAERGVGCPRVVVGEAAHMASVCVSTSAVNRDAKGGVPLAAQHT